MPESSRRALLASVGACIATAGCLADLDGSGGTDDPTRTETTTDTTTTTDATTTTSEIGWERAANEFSPDHRIELRNKSDETRTVRVWVVHDASDKTVFENTYTLEPGFGPIAYNLREAEPDGVEAFRVCAEFVDSTNSGNESTTGSDGSSTTTEHSVTTTADARNCTRIETSTCYGGVELVVEEDGSLGAIYAIC